MRQPPRGMQRWCFQPEVGKTRPTQSRTERTTNKLYVNSGISKTHPWNPGVLKHSHFTSLELSPQRSALSAQKDFLSSVQTE